MGETRSEDNLSHSSHSVTIAQAELGSRTAQTLIAALNAELSQRYPEPGATHFRLDAEEMAEGRGAFFIAWRGDTAIGCAAVRRIEPDAGEVKRMYVVPEERGCGIGRMLLAELESQARRLGMTRLVLETGVRQTVAMALYRSAGFADTEPFGEYVDSPLSVCLAKNL